VTTRLVFDQAALRALLEGEDGDVGKDLARRAIKVEAAAKRLCSVDTGRLRSSITWEMARDDQGLMATVGTDVEYGVYIELGTSHMAAQPFLRPALEAAR
jgi:HK97 gp10 family phage protein